MSNDYKMERLNKMERIADYWFDDAYIQGFECWATTFRYLCADIEDMLFDLEEGKQVSDEDFNRLDERAVSCFREYEEDEDKE